MKISSFLNLRKPEGKDNYNVDDMNYNFEKVEQTISTMQTRQSDSVKNLQAQIDKKQSQLSFDSEPKANSSNFVNSGGIFKYLQNIISNKQDKLSFDTTPTANSSKMLTSGAVYTAIKDFSKSTEITGLGTAAYKNVPTSGNAGTDQVVMGNDSRLKDSRKASDVYDWAKASSKPSYTKSEVGLGNVPNVTTNNQVPTFSQASSRANLVGKDETLSTILGKVMKWFADLKTVAFSGKYTDLTNTPAVMDAATANAGTDTTGKLITAAVLKSGVATHASTIDTKSNKVTFTAATFASPPTNDTANNNIKSNETHAVIFGKIARWFSLLTKVAFTANYNDLNNRPGVMSTAEAVAATDQTGKLVPPVVMGTLVREKTISREFNGVELASIYELINKICTQPIRSYAFDFIIPSDWEVYVKEKYFTQGTYHVVSTGCVAQGGNKYTGHAIIMPYTNSIASPAYKLIFRDYSHSAPTLCSFRVSVLRTMVDADNIAYEDAHAEGYHTMATGAAAHSEGSETYAFGDFSHAGGYRTSAYGIAQTVVGRLNNDTNAIFVVGDGYDRLPTTNSGQQDWIQNGCLLSQSIADEKQGNFYAQQYTPLDKYSVINTHPGVKGGAELYCNTSSESAAKTVATNYGIEFIHYKNGIATFHTEQDLDSIIAKRKNNTSWPILYKNEIKTVLFGKDDSGNSHYMDVNDSMNIESVRRNALEVLPSGGVYLREAQYHKRGVIKDKLSDNTIQLDCGASYLLICNNRNLNGKKLGGQCYVIIAPYRTDLDNPYRIQTLKGMDTSALAVPTAFSLGSAGTAGVKLQTGAVEADDGTFLPTLGISTTGKNVCTRYSLMKIMGSEEDFPTIDSGHFGGIMDINPVWGN